uniref:FAD-dependent oxidoreductase domain-containing protein 1 n=1 Tax=Arion vulgaris TaxID=1028688 RepID=A0A0B6ZAQ8_9EUPU
MVWLILRVLHKNILYHAKVINPGWRQNAAKTVMKWRQNTRSFATNNGSAGDDWEHSHEKDAPTAGKYKSPWKIHKDKYEGLDAAVSENEIPKETDILIIGGGVIGSSVAYWIKQQNPKASSITVIERDPVYTRASSMLSCGGIRHQFSVPENVQLSMFGSKFLTNIKQHLSVLHESLPDVQFTPQGYLFLATSSGVEQLSTNVTMQQELGAKVVLLTKKQIQEKYPWLNLEGVECGSLGLEGEGWFDPWSLVRGFKQKNISMGAKYVHGELISFEFRSLGTSDDQELRLDSAVIRTTGGRECEVKFSLVINCAGPWAAEVAEMANIGTGKGALAVPLPVEPRKRYVYVTHCPDGPMLDCPFVIDYSGVYFRREGLGGNYICGSSPASEADEPKIDNFEVDYNFYEESIWPVMAHRAPCFNNSRSNLPGPAITITMSLTRIL